MLFTGANHVLDTLPAFCSLTTLGLPSVCSLGCVQRKTDRHPVHPRQTRVLYPHHSSAILPFQIIPKLLAAPLSLVLLCDSLSRPPPSLLRPLVHTRPLAPPAQAGRPALGRAEGDARGHERRDLPPCPSVAGAFSGEPGTKPVKGGACPRSRSSRWPFWGNERATWVGMQWIEMV